jgi:5'-nucleotidase
VRFLVTNDDGIVSFSLPVRPGALWAGAHDTFVAAPRSEQSWTSASKTRHSRVHSCEVDVGLGCPCWSVDGTPSDCVNIAIDHLMEHAPDAVLSGINIGLNASLGFILGSGTVAGACEGALHGIPGISLSQCLPPSVYDGIKDAGDRSAPALIEQLKISAAHAAALAPDLASRTPPRSFVVHNVNFPYPCASGSQLRRTVPARTILPGLFSPRDADGTHKLVFWTGEDLSPESPMTDRAALDAGFISHTVLDFTKLGSI